MVRGRRNCSSHCRLSPLYKVNYGKAFQGYLYQYIISESICIIIAESVSNMITVFIFRRVTSRRCRWKSRDSKFPLCSSTLLDVLADYSNSFIRVILSVFKFSVRPFSLPGYLSQPQVQVSSLTSYCSMSLIFRQDRVKFPCFAISFNFYLSMWRNMFAFVSFIIVTTYIQSSVIYRHSM